MDESLHALLAEAQIAEMTERETSVLAPQLALREDYACKQQFVVTSLVHTKHNWLGVTIW